MHSHSHHHNHGGHHHDHHGHDHGHHHLGSSCKSAALKNIRLAFFLNLSFTIIEIVGGILTQSVAVLSDAVHDAGDTLSLGIALCLEKKSEIGPSKRFSYGMKRLSLLSAVISGVVITMGSGIVLWEAIPRLWDPGEPKGLGMMALAGFGIAVNGFAALRLKQGQTQNEQVLTWHLMEDAMGWGAVLLGGAFVYFLEWNWMDPLLGVLISVWIIRNVLKQLNRSISLFLQGTPDLKKLEEFSARLETFPGVVSYHDLHLWSLDGSSHVLSMHLVTTESGDKLIELKNQVRDAAKVLGSPHITLEIESPDEECVDNCDDQKESI